MRHYLTLLDRLENAIRSSENERRATERVQTQYHETVHKLVQAENRIETLTRGNETPTAVVALVKAMAENRTIDAIKQYRVLTGYGLKESKDAIIAVQDNFRARPLGPLAP